MFRQNKSETVTLTRSQLHAILELITQIGGTTNSSETRNNVISDHTINTNRFIDNNVNEEHLLSDCLNWDNDKEDIMSRSEWISNKTQRSDNQLPRTSSLVLLNDNNIVNNRVLSSAMSDISKVDELRNDSAMTNSDHNHRRYAKVNDSEFDWNELQQKKLKTLEYRKALALQYEEKQRLKIKEQQKIRREEQLLEKRIEEQRIKMRKDYEMERNLMEEKRLLSEKKREAVVEAIGRTEPIIRKRNFLIDRDSDIQTSVVAEVKPQTRTRDISAQTETNDSSSQYSECGTQTDVQLLLHLLNDLKLITKDKHKAKSKSYENLSTDSTSSANTHRPRLVNRNKDYDDTKDVQNKNKLINKRPVWQKNHKFKNVIKTNDKTTNLVPNKAQEDETNLVELKINHQKNESNNDLLPMKKLRRNSLTKSALNLNTLQSSKKRIMSSIESTKQLNFLPDIRPNSRKKWFSQQSFDPNFLS